MLNKLKKAVKYIVKKVKQGVEIIAKTINDTKCAVAHVAETGINTVGEIKKTKLDLTKTIGSSLYNDIKSVLSGMNKPEYKIIIGFGLAAIGIVDKLNNRKEV